MKRNLLVVSGAIAAVLVAVPAVVSARRGSDAAKDPQKSQNSNRREDLPSTAAERAWIASGRTPSPRPDATITPSPTPSQTVTPSPSPTPSATPTTGSDITSDDAKAIASLYVPGVGIDEVEKEFEDGILVWKVKFLDDSRVLVRATDGDVVSVRIGDAAEDDSRSDDDSNEDEDDSDDDDDSSRGRRRNGRN